MKALFGKFDLGKVLAVILLYTLLALVFAWTMSLTIGLAAQVFPTNYWAQYFAVALFDGGAITWMIVFIKLADGLVQRIEAAGLCAVDALGMCIVSGVEILLGGQQLVKIGEHIGEVALAIVILWTIINAIGGLLFHLSNPHTIQDILQKNQEDKIQLQTYSAYDKKIDEIAERVADEKAEKKVAEMLKALEANYEANAYRLPAPSSSNGHKDEPITVNPTTRQ